MKNVKIGSMVKIKDLYNLLDNDMSEATVRAIVEVDKDIQRNRIVKVICIGEDNFSFLDFFEDEFVIGLKDIEKVISY